MLLLGKAAGRPISCFRDKLRFQKQGYRILPSQVHASTKLQQVVGFVLRPPGRAHKGGGYYYCWVGQNVAQSEKLLVMARGWARLAE